ncbi:major pollen allergen Ole e 10-like [Gastrolobium bilobum]|uniref:major pollen allergen Ole e 10-like n=1 Tax=Gastrolobium bilobum TaxID=150636 RepID=UPI002AB2A5E1|nr:major pollen allergen Ole e 10-like [Gastrolobium bilobum]
MRKKVWFFMCLAFMECYLAMARGIVVQEKSDSAMPVTILSPPEGNTTFIDGITWCVALAGVSQADLQNALDWVCRPENVDCKPIKIGGSCFEPDTLLSHASYAFNNYYQTNGNSDVACNFGGTATTTKKNPSYGKCVYSSSGSADSFAPPLFGKHNQSFLWPKLATLLLISYFWM